VPARAGDADRRGRGSPDPGLELPLPPQKQQLGTIAQDFQRELAVGYRMSAYELCAPDGRVPFLRGKAVSTALARAMCHSAAQLTKAYLVYMTAPAGTWLTLHTLFRFAQILKLDDKAIDDRRCRARRSARARSTSTRCCSRSATRTG
jgi:hypothetical protein